MSLNLQYTEFYKNQNISGTFIDSLCFIFSPILISIFMGVVLVHLFYGRACFPVSILITSV